MSLITQDLENLLTAVRLQQFVPWANLRGFSLCSVVSLKWKNLGCITYRVKYFAAHLLLSCFLNSFTQLKFITKGGFRLFLAKGKENIWLFLCWLSLLHNHVKQFCQYKLLMRHKRQKKSHLHLTVTVNTMRSVSIQCWTFSYSLISKESPQQLGPHIWFVFFTPFLLHPKRDLYLLLGSNRGSFAC